MGNQDTVSGAYESGSAKDALTGESEPKGKSNADLQPTHTLLEPVLAFLARILIVS